MKFSIKSFLTDEINYFLYIWESSITDYLEIILNNARKIPPFPDEQIDENCRIKVIVTRGNIIRLGNGFQFTIVKIKYFNRI